MDAARDVVVEPERLAEVMTMGTGNESQSGAWSLANKVHKLYLSLDRLEE